MDPVIWVTFGNDAPREKADALTGITVTLARVTKLPKGSFHVDVAVITKPPSVVDCASVRASVNTPTTSPVFKSVMSASAQLAVVVPKSVAGMVHG